MDTNTVSKLCNAICIEVACERNEPEDIEFGGPLMLGYTFYVSADVDITDWKNFIKDCIDRYNRPYISMSATFKKNYNSKYLMSREMIDDIIKTNPL